jgi:deoxyribonuclease V
VAWKRGIIDLVNFRELHPWDVTPQEAAAIQLRLSSAVEQSDRLGPLRRVAGLDVGFEADGTLTRAAVVVLAFPIYSWKALVRLPTGFHMCRALAIREAPAILLPWSS